MSHLQLTLLLLTTQIFATVQGQHKFWVATEQLATIEDAHPTFCSKWLQACTVELTAAEAASLQILPTQRVRSFELTGAPTDAAELGFALEQIEGQLLIDQGVTGKGVKIGIIDGGFLGATKDPSLGPFFEEDRVKWYKDFIDPSAEPFSGFRALDDDHGTQVWGLIGGIHAETGVQFGLATGAEYYLARTDHGSYEKRIEEDYLIAALEAMDSMGVRLINISLGYSTGYTDTSENYKPEDMDGKTSMMARAIDHAFDEKDMLVVVAAGNEGSVAHWQIVSTPGDARGALSVGAAKFKVWDRMQYSSIGPEQLPYIKPDVSVYAAAGTSFSAPVITGLAACLMEIRPDLSVREIRRLIEQSGHLYPFSNNYLGHGVPQVSKLLQLLEGEEPERPILLKTKKSSLKFRGDIEGQVVVLYHKTDARNVRSRLFLRPEKGAIKIRRHANAAFTTILVGGRATEIEWLD